MDLETEVIWALMLPRDLALNSTPC